MAPLKAAPLEVSALSRAPANGDSSIPPKLQTWTPALVLPPIEMKRSPALSKNMPLTAWSWFDVGRPVISGVTELKLSLEESFETLPM